MRLMQLARQLGKSQQEIVDFLLSQNIEMKLHGNSKVPDEALPLIHEHWAPTAEESSDQPKEELPAVTNTETPEVEEEIFPTTTPQENEASAPTKTEGPLAVTQDTPPPPSQVIEDPETEAEKPEVTVIRAKKVKLEGIKVLGKIDLPEPKPKKEETPTEEKETQEREKTHRRPYKSNNRKGKRRKQPESYEQKQKRQEREELRKKKFKEKKLKEKKKKYYEENIKNKLSQSSTKKKSTKTSSAASRKKKTVEKHSNPIKRFWAWLNGAYDQ